MDGNTCFIQEKLPANLAFQLGFTPDLVKITSLEDVHRCPQPAQSCQGRWEQQERGKKNKPETGKGEPKITESEEPS